MDMFEADTYMELTAKALSPAQKETSYVSSSESMKSIGRIRDTRITDLEEKLAMAEDRCSVLRNQVAYMKMLYTNNNGRGNPNNEEETLKAAGEYKEIEENIKNTISNPYNYKPENRDFKRMPANMTVKPLGGTTLTKDPKEAMQMIVNEMTQSVNAMEGSVNIHSNTIEGVMLSSRHRKKRANKREEWSSPKIKKNPTATAQRAPAKKLGNQTREAEMKSLDSKSKASVNSVKTVKKRPNSKFNAGSKPIAMSRNHQELQEVKEIPRKQAPDVRRAGSEAIMTRVASSTYLLPTLSYRMKCVPKSYRREFSFHRIPFVLGKSTNKSHNLGAKIQETLSMIKLSRKGLQSATQGKKEELNNLLHNPTGDPNVVPAEPSMYRATMSSQSKIRPPTLTPGATSDYKNYQLRTVLMNLHDEFSKMTENYESLKASLKERYDPEVNRRIQNLEEDLNAKEIEINAFMNLYNEVSQLKDKLSSAQSGYPLNSIYKPASCYTDSTSTLKMTRLLRRIEQFQDQLKTMSYI